jgi:hypothetical protein
MKKIISLIIVTFFTVFTQFTAPVSAVTLPNPCDKGYATDCPKPGPDNLKETVGEVIRIAFVAIGILAVVMIIYGAIRLTTSGGNAETVKTARRIILYSVAGLAVALLAGFVVSVVFNATGEIFKQV